MPLSHIARWSTGVLLLVAGCSGRPEAPVTSASDGGSKYLYLWTASADSSAPDFLAVLDVQPDTGRYGSLVATLPVAGHSNVPHHSEHSMPADGQLFVNGFGSGQSFIFDLRDGAHPKLAGSFGDEAGFMHPHSFLRLPNGNVLATYQMSHAMKGAAPGGLVEMTPAGQVVRSSPAAGPGVPSGLRVYSGAIIPSIDRIVTTTTDMDESNPWKADRLQVWRLSDLVLLHTFSLPASPGDVQNYAAEPRLLADGKTVMVSTITCGLFLLSGLDGDTPSAQLVGTEPSKPGVYCAIPLVSGRYWIMTVPAIPAVVGLDISDPAHPKEASRVVLDSADVPHWISLEPNTKRLVITGYRGLENRVLIASFDSATGALALDARFAEAGANRPGFLMSGKTWPHGGTGAGVPHGAVFSRPE